MPVRSYGVALRWPPGMLLWPSGVTTHTQCIQSSAYLQFEDTTLLKQHGILEELIKQSFVPT
jgi:hypothetical protein